MKSGPDISVRTTRLVLRPLIESDRAEFLRVETVSADAWRQWMATPPPDDTPLDYFRRTVTPSDVDPRAIESLRCGAFLHDGRLAGIFNLNNIVRGAFHNAHASWRVSADLTGAGYATEAVNALLDLAFSARGLALHRVQANVIPTNAASLRVAEKCGFRREGLALRYLCIAGQWQDHVMHAKLSDEHVCRWV